MKHVLHHDRDFNCGAVDLFLDVTLKDMKFTEQQLALVKAAVAAKMRVGVITRAFGGTTVFAYEPPSSSAETLLLISSVMHTLARPQTPELRCGGFDD